MYVQTLKLKNSFFSGKSFRCFFQPFSGIIPEKDRIKAETFPEKKRNLLSFKVLRQNLLSIRWMDS